QNISWKLPDVSKQRQSGDTVYPKKLIMKTYRFIAVFLLLANAGSASEVSDPNCLLSEMNREIAGVTNHYDELLDVQFETLNQIDRSMLTTLNNCDKVDLLLRKDRVLTEIRILRND